MSEVQRRTEKEGAKEGEQQEQQQQQQQQQHALSPSPSNSTTAPRCLRTTYAMHRMRSTEPSPIIFAFLGFCLSPMIRITMANSVGFQAVRMSWPTETSAVETRTRLTSAVRMLTVSLWKGMERLRMMVSSVMEVMCFSFGALFFFSQLNVVPPPLPALTAGCPSACDPRPWRTTTAGCTSAPALATSSARSTAGIGLLEAMVV